MVLEWHSRGQRFDPAWLHQKSPVTKEKAVPDLGRFFGFLDGCEGRIRPLATALPQIERAASFPETAPEIYGDGPVRVSKLDEAQSGFKAFGAALRPRPP